MNRSLLVDKKMGSGQPLQRTACVRACFGAIRDSVLLKLPSGVEVSGEVPEEEGRGQ